MLRSKMPPLRVGSVILLVTIFVNVAQSACTLSDHVIKAEQVLRENESNLKYVGKDDVRELMKSASNASYYQDVQTINMLTESAKELEFSGARVNAKTYAAIAENLGIIRGPRNNEVITYSRKAAEALMKGGGPTDEIVKNSIRAGTPEDFARAVKALRWDTKEGDAIVREILEGKGYFKVVNDGSISSFQTARAQMKGAHERSAMADFIEYLSKSDDLKYMDMDTAETVRKVAPRMGQLRGEMQQRFEEAANYIERNNPMKRNPWN